MEFREGSWAFLDNDLVLITKMRKGKIKEVSDGFYRISGSNLECYHLTLENKRKWISDLVVHLTAAIKEQSTSEKQEPAAFLDKSTQERPGDSVWLPSDLKGMDTSKLVPLYAVPPVTAPALLTDERIYEMAEEGCFLGTVREVVKAIEEEVLRANCLK